MKPKNPLLFVLFLVFVLLNIADLITALFILPGESNPLFLLTGSIWPLIILKGLVILGIGFYTIRNIYPTHFALYLMLLIVVFGILSVGLAVFSNTMGIINPDLVQEQANVPKAERMQAYGIMSTVFFIVPVVLSLVVFLIYRTALKKAKVDKQYFKKRKWWQP